MDGLPGQEPPRGSGARFVVAGLLSTVLVAGVIIAALAGFGGGEDGVAGHPTTPGGTPAPTATATPATLPPQRTKNLETAAKRAGCTLQDPRVEGALHDDREFTAADYGTNPPTSGMHAPTWAPDGIYQPGNTPDLGTLVHTLEHGRIDIQYAPGTDEQTISLLGELYEEMDNGYHLLLFENSTQMPYAVAATAWNQLLGCPQMNDKVFDAIRAFTATYIDQGPEIVP